MSLNPEKELLEGLPPYTHGTMSSSVFNAGEGLNDNRVLSDPDNAGLFKDGEALSGDEFRDRILQLQTRGYFMYNPTGAVSFGYYCNQRMAVAEYKNGVVRTSFLDDYKPAPSCPVLLRVVTGTERRDFLAYLDRLPGCGLKQIAYRELENNIFAEYTDSERLIECSFYGDTGKAIFAEDKVSTPLCGFGYGSRDTGAVEFYQFGLNHRRMVSGFTCDCGMCYIIRLNDNSVVMVDGGELEQITHRTTEALWDLIHRVTGTKPGETVHIAAWFCTHAHDDHMDMFSHLIGVHHDEIDLQRVMFNFPDTQQVTLMPQTYLMINRVRNLYPDVKYRKLHTGDLFTLAGVTFEVMLTHEAGFDMQGATLTGMNDNSTIMKISYEGRSFEILGDVDGSAEKVVLSYLSGASLHADIVQAAHHVFNYLENLYDVIDADYCFVPQNEDVRRNGNNRKFAQITRTVPADHFCFSGSGSDGFRIENGQLIHHFSEPLVADLYDGTRV